MAATRPRVSICIPSYNYGRFIGEAIASVLSQDYTDFELVVSDDGSSDNTGQVVASFNDQRVSYHVNPKNLGAYGNDNKCIDLAAGEYICLLDADDVMLAGNLASKVRVLNERPEVGLVYSSCNVIDQNSKYLWTRRSFDTDYVHSPREELQNLFFDNHIHFSSVMVRRRCYEEVGVFGESFTHSGDYDLWLRIAARYQVAFLAEPLTAARLHGENSTSRAIPDGRSEAESLAAIERAFRDLPPELEDLRVLRPRAVCQTLLRCAAYYLALGDPEKGRSTIERAVTADPTIARDPATIFGTLLGPAVESLISERVAHLSTVFAYLPPELAHLRGYRRKLASDVYMERVFAALSAPGARPRSRDLWHGIWLDPAWLRNPGIRSTILKSLAGGWGVNLARHMSRAVSRGV